MTALAAEQIREQRRKERKQFKIDRAAAMLEAAMKAEAVLTTGQLPDGYVAPTGEVDVEGEVEVEGEGEGDADAEAEGDNEVVDRPASPAPSTLSLATDAASTVAPTSLTPQTFLVRPTRPDANRNRGKKPFRRRPPPPAAQAADGSTPAAAPTPAPTPRPPPPPPAPEEESASEDEAAALVPHMEHLQLNLQEALFLCTLGVLKVQDPATDTIVPVTAIIARFLTPIDPPRPLSPAPRALYPDDPLLVSYAAYHHYRSLGWCVRDGIKFCVDWLLYRRGPVFSHSA